MAKKYVCAVCGNAVQEGLPVMTLMTELPEGGWRHVTSGSAVCANERGDRDIREAR